MSGRRNLPLYHWSPVERRKQIIRYGLRPAQRTTTTGYGVEEWRAPYVCFADSPSWAWALSGQIVADPGTEWDLWQTWLHDLTAPKVMRDPDRPSGIYEVRTWSRLPKSGLWHVATRTA